LRHISPLVTQYGFELLLHEASQRFALAAGGRDEIRSESRKNSKPEKCLKTAQSPTSRLHALLGTIGLEDSLVFEKNLA